MTFQNYYYKSKVHYINHSNQKFNY